MPASYTPKPSGGTLLPGIPQLVEQAKKGRLVLYVGAGVSAAAPTNGPMGTSVADGLRSTAAAMLGCAKEDLAGDTLEQLASRVEAVGADALFKLQSYAVTAFEFAFLEPNFGHRVIAILMREGLARTITVNWDCCVENAGLKLGVSITAVTSELTAQSLAGALPLYKVHGNSTQPETLKITQADVDAPQEWAIAQVHSALTSGTVVFVGLATVGGYVSDPINRVMAEWSNYAKAIGVVAPTLPPTWAEILGSKGESSHFPAYSDDFFDDLLRGLAQDCLTHVQARASIAAGLEGWAEPMAAGVSALAIEVLAKPAEEFIQWWRSAVSPEFTGRPFITEDLGQNALMAAAFLIGQDGGVEVRGVGRRFSVRTPSQYLEIIYRPRAHLDRIMSVARDRTSERWRDGAYEDSRYVSWVVVGATGRFPALDAVVDIAGADNDEDDISTEMHGDVRFVSAEDALQGRLAA